MIVSLSEQHAQFCQFADEQMATRTTKKDNDDFSYSYLSWIPSPLPPPLSYRLYPLDSSGIQSYHTFLP